MEKQVLSFLFSSNLDYSCDPRGKKTGNTFSRYMVHKSISFVYGGK